MILTLHVENTLISIGGYKEGRLGFAVRMKTDVGLTEDQYAAAMAQLIAPHGLTGGKGEGGIVSSVVPELTERLRSALSRFCTGKVYVVSPGLKTGLNIRSQNPAMFGSDIVCGCAAAVKRYPSPCVVADIGTAVSFSALDENGSLIGKALFPGPEIALQALSDKAALLPRVGLGEPGELIAAGTTDAMRSGLVYGYASMIDGMFRRFRARLGGSPTLVATGALAGLLVPHCEEDIQLDEHLVLDGLYQIYCKNAPPVRD
ncbi:type III pantothenate kinase [Zongyangia hominis]|uniref:Type III pantothenate kinase n=1 Tax=Zongyangia hominis TaxID=2763677 RepID=A0A926EDA4_9FIRM|nr:type III pantothenate kinase [Zongyangia hominis]MBC8570970.1 type III pantothenate kinase [Zongyangia hominis]